ncbi:Uu.00g130720.m01.CDS01 [Anthostomella pinea]|uniref:GPI mannosyltransferase 2 n=1 Tax=Anthostomella pinea TaxID=933095 RepID=A0AAI8VIN9_9PEZI|nr:Uu.00g130720.m01.CDS01 [Anthostomella pinea]
MSSFDARHPVQGLLGAFLAWKAFLFAIAVGSAVGPAYDTSSTLITTGRASYDESPLDLATRLTRWDAMYFIQASRRGYLFEQEWAFGAGLPAVISALAKSSLLSSSRTEDKTQLTSIALATSGLEADGSLESLIGICVANISHLLSVLVLYQLGMVVFKNSRMSFVAALLHILSPAGIFLSAPYNESPFALLSFTGYLFFAKAVLGEKRSLAHDVSLVASGMWFGFALTFRSNGILNGIPFAAELLRELSSPPTLDSVRRRVALVVGGSAVAIGFILPQVTAYRTFCYEASTTDLRPWCTRRLPSIYSFVQEHYWSVSLTLSIEASNIQVRNVGFLRYWTPPNIPLFILAAPMLYLLGKSGLDILSKPDRLSTAVTNPRVLSNTIALLRSMASAQLILTVLAITTYHIQIITRISSGYPILYWWIANCLTDSKIARFGGNVVVFMVMYAGIQGALFASFLPPA